MSCGKRGGVGGKLGCARPSCSSFIEGNRYAPWSSPEHTTPQGISAIKAGSAHTTPQGSSGIKAGSAPSHPFTSSTPTAAYSYVPPPPANSKASYATMVYVRATIVRDAGDFLGRAVTIATRYTAVRRQTAPLPGERELQVGGRVGREEGGELGLGCVWAAAAVHRRQALVTTVSGF